MRILVVVYSLTGTTSGVARELATQLGADLEEIRCDDFRRGTLGFFRAAFTSWRGKIPEISPRMLDPSAYDLVLVGGPIWSWNICTPVRAWLKRESKNLPRIAFFATAAGASFDTAFATMQSLAGKPPLETLALSGEIFREARDHDSITLFAQSLRDAVPA